MASDEFARHVREWLTIDTQLKEAAKASKDLRRRRNDLKGWIVDFMEESDIGNCQLPEAQVVLRLIKRETRIRPAKDAVIGRMNDWLRQRGIRDVTGGDLFQYIYEDGAERREAVTLSRRAMPGAKRQKTTQVIEEQTEPDESAEPTEEDGEEDMGTI